MLDPLKMEAVLRRGPAVAEAVSSWRSVDERRRKLQAELDNMRAEKNSANDRMKKLDKSSAEFAAARDEMKALSTRIKEGEVLHGALEAESQSTLLGMPNAPHADVPDGTTEADNQVHHVWGDKPTYAFAPKAHWDLGPALGIIDFERGTKIARARFAVLMRAGAQLERALINFMLSISTRANTATPRCEPPFLVNSASACTAPGSCRSSSRTCSRSRSRRVGSVSHLPPPRCRSPTSTAARSSTAARCRSLHVLHAVFPQRSRFVRRRRARADPPAPVRQGRAREVHDRRAVVRRTRGADRERRAKC
jgi:hypothetical protein